MKTINNYALQTTEAYQELFIKAKASTQSVTGLLLLTVRYTACENATCKTNLSLDKTITTASFHLIVQVPQLA